MDTPELIKDTLDRAYKDMDPSTGMYPADWRCLVCGKQLNADGNHPAELYAGTFNGLCYACTSGGPYVVPGSELPDGTRRMSHPPACPSWRRTREEYWGHPDCEHCKGMGAHMRYSSMNQYREYCRPCMDRVTAPRKRAERELLTAVADTLEAAELTPVEAREPLSAAQATVSAWLTLNVRPILARWDDQPGAWRPQYYLLQQAESRLTAAQFRAKRSDTLRRHLVAALRAEADSVN
jgi:hypothetical protein